MGTKLSLLFNNLEWILVVLTIGIINLALFSKIVICVFFDLKWIIKIKEQRI